MPVKIPGEGDTVYENVSLEYKDRHVRTFYIGLICSGLTIVMYSNLFDENGLRYTTYRQDYIGEDLQTSPIWYMLYR